MLYEVITDPGILARLEEQRAAENIAASVGAELDRLQAMLRT